MTPRTKSPRTGSTAPSEISAQAFHWTAGVLECFPAFCEHMCETVMQLPCHSQLVLSSHPRAAMADSWHGKVTSSFRLDLAAEAIYHVRAGWLSMPCAGSSLHINLPVFGRWVLNKCTER